jgi:hypothetical protein
VPYFGKAKKENKKFYRKKKGVVHIGKDWT